MTPNTVTASAAKPDRRSRVSRRQDIDLLRAVAVLAIILFHFDEQWLPGGFLGVDVFFVISGFLITSLLVREIDSRSFTFLGFYARRMRRIAPALLVTLLATSAAATILLPHHLLARLAHSQVFAAGYVSNIDFWQHAGYFDMSAAAKPLLHTWSLGVEEQFYLVWPLVLLLAAWRRWWVWILLLGSILGAELVLLEHPSLAFYGFPFRISEFAVGALLALRSGAAPVRLANVTAAICVLWIVVCLMIFDRSTAMPGVLSMVVCIPVAILIWARSPVLNESWWLRPLAFVGLISYSAYLIHWPLIVFAGFVSDGGPGVSTFFLTLLLAVFMWRYVEQPFQRVSITRARSKVAFLATVPAGVLFATGFCLWVSRQGDDPGANARLLAQLEATRANRALKREQADELPAFWHNDSVLRVLVIGDSHALDGLHAVKDYLPESMAIRRLGSICDPLALDDTEDIERLMARSSRDPRIARSCRPYHRQLYRRIERQRPDMIIFSERWEPRAMPFLAESLKRIRQLGATIVVLGSKTEFELFPEQMVSVVPNLAELNRFAFDRRTNREKIHAAVEDAAREAEVYFVDQDALVCQPGKGSCDYLIASGLSYEDRHHWSDEGMIFFGQRLMRQPAMREALAEVVRHQRQGESAN